jgi:hypothetical protein
MTATFRRPPLARLALAFVSLAAAWGAAAGAGAAADPPEEIRWPSAAGEVVFAHRFHAEETGADCAACHHETVAAALAVPHPDYFDDFWVDCATCHTAAASSTAQRCASCHPEKPTGPNVEMPTAKVAIHRSCWGCHEIGRGTDASAQCGICHQRPVAPARAAEGASPAAAR